MKDAVGAFILAGSAAAIAVLSAVSLDRYETAAARSGVEPRGTWPPTTVPLREEIHRRVGERRWRSEVMPSFNRRLAARYVWGTGNAFPSREELLEWSHEHPAEVKTILREAAAGTR